MIIVLSHTLLVQSSTACKLQVHQYFRLINESLRVGLFLVWPMCKAFQTVLGAGAADESIMRLSIDGTKRIHVLCKRSRAAARQTERD